MIIKYKTKKKKKLKKGKIISVYYSSCYSNIDFMKVLFVRIYIYS